MHPPMDCGKRMVIISMAGFLSSRQVRVPGEQPPGKKIRVQHHGCGDLRALSISHMILQSERILKGKKKNISLVS